LNQQCSLQILYTSLKGSGEPDLYSAL